MKKEKQLLLLALFGVATAAAYFTAHASILFDASVQVAEGGDPCDKDEDDEDPGGDNADTMPSTLHAQSA